MEIAVVIPDRPGREVFRPIWTRYLARQTVLPDYTYIMDQAPLAPIDLSERCKRGARLAVDAGVDLIFFIENDDWYSPDYLQMLCAAWEDAGRPDAVGIEETYYYHLSAEKLFHQKHPGRSSLFCTAISADFAKRFIWGRVNEPWLDIEIWRQAKTKAFARFVSKPLAVGLKHGIGYGGGKAHNGQWGAYKPAPNGWAKDILGEDLQRYGNILPE